MSIGKGLRSSGLLNMLMSTNPSVGPAGLGAERWRDTALQALSDEGESPLLVNSLLRRMNQESGGNPTIVNTTDSNWFAGYPSVGLMQVIRGTYAAHKDPLHDVGPYEYGVSV